MSHVDKAAPAGKREAFEAYRDQRNALLESEGHKPGSKWHITQAHYSTWEAGAAYQRQSGVVMPERKEHETYYDSDEYRKDGWNACLDEFARLNGAGSHE